MAFPTFSFTNTMAVLISPLGDEQIPEILSFIEPYEAECVNLVHEILNGAENCFVVQKDGMICGAFCFRARRTVFHCLPFTKYKTQQDKILCQETQAAFYEFFANEKPFCINGESTGSLFLKNILKNKTPSLAAKVVNEYWLLSVSSRSEQSQEVASISNSFCQVIDVCSKSNVFRATSDDAEKLFPLEKGYQYEEVIPQNFSVSDETLREALKLNLQKQKIFVCQATVTGNSEQNSASASNDFCEAPASTPNGFGTPVAKAAVTAMGKNFALIGGVYTLPEYRRRGYARVLVQHILQELAAPSTSNGSCKAGSLYVKKKNAAAIALYKSLGFEQAGEYKLIYF